MVMPWIKLSSHKKNSFAESETIFLFVTLAIPSLETFLKNSCKEVMKKLLMLNISSNAIFMYSIPSCSSSSKVSYFYSVLLINIPSK